MSRFSKYHAGLLFVGGIVAGVIVSLAVIRVSGFALVSQQDLDAQLREIAELRDENRELLDDLIEQYGEEDGSVRFPVEEWKVLALISDLRQG